MSREHVELALQAFDAINRRHLDALLALIDDDVEIVTRIVAMEGGLHGHDGMPAGGRTRSRSSRTTTSRSSTCVTSGT
jgi:hypothetical protein